jgi:hypothetical protein
MKRLTPNQINPNAADGRGMMELRVWQPVGGALWWVPMETRGYR